MTVASDVSFEQSRPGGPLDFPTLEMLLIRTSDSQMRSYSSFRMPVLKELILTFNIARVPMIRGLATVLASCKMLERLTLEINDGDYQPAPYPDINIPSLRCFEVNLWNHTKLQTGAILKQFRAPNLRKFSIYIRTPCSIPPDGVFDNLNFGESVQSFEFTYPYFLESSPFSVPFRLIARQLPNISKLTICCHRTPFTKQLRECRMPTLLHLQVLWESAEYMELDEDDEPLEIIRDKFVDDVFSFLLDRKRHSVRQGGGYIVCSS